MERRPYFALFNTIKKAKTYYAPTSTATVSQVSRMVIASVAENHHSKVRLSSVLHLLQFSLYFFELCIFFVYRGRISVEYFEFSVAEKKLAPIVLEVDSNAFISAIGAELKDDHTAVESVSSSGDASSLDKANAETREITSIFEEVESRKGKGRETIRRYFRCRICYR